MACASCHGVNGASDGGVFPRVGGQPALYLSEQLQDFKSKARANAIMAPMHRPFAELEQYKQLASPSFKEYPAIIRAIHGRTEVFEGSVAEDIVILEFPTYEDAKAWYHSSAYQAASKHRHQGGDYRFILTEGTSAH